MEDQVRRFNAANQDMRVELTLIPEGEYNTQVQATAADGRLPDLLDLDGPYLYNYAWKGHLVPLDNYLSADIRNDLLPSILTQGAYMRWAPLIQDSACMAAEKNCWPWAPGCRPVLIRPGVLMSLSRFWQRWPCRMRTAWSLISGLITAANGLLTLFPRFCNPLPAI